MHKTGEIVAIQFCVSDPTTGGLANADSLPTGTLALNGVNNGATVTVANVSTGVYSASITLPTVTDGDELQIRIAATVGGVSGGGIVWQGEGCTKRPADVFAVVGSGTGAYECTWTVNDGVAVLQNATVSFWLNGILKGTGTTGVAGTVPMSLDAGTYTVAITCEGHTFAGTTHVVSATAGTWAHTFSMSDFAVSPETDPAKTTAYWYIYGNDSELVGDGDVTLTVEILELPDDHGRGYDDAPLSRSSTAAGLISASMFKGAKYRVVLSDDREWVVEVPLTAGSTYKLPPIRVVSS